MGYLHIMLIIESLRKIIARYVKSALDVGGVKISSNGGTTIQNESAKFSLNIGY